jgi:hypothetical protein
VWLGEIDDPWSQSLGMKSHSHGIDRGVEQTRVDSLSQHDHRCIRCDNVRTAIGYERRVRPVCVEDDVEGLANRSKVRNFKRQIRECRSEPRGEQDPVAFAPAPKNRPDIGR